MTFDINMIFSGEPLPGESLKEGSIRDALDGVFKEYASVFEVLDPHETMLMTAPTELILAGKLKSVTVGEVVDISLVNWRQGTNDITFITAGKQQYEISDAGIFCTSTPNDKLTDWEIEQIRFWLHPGTAIWTRKDSIIMAEKWKSLEQHLDHDSNISAEDL